MTGIESIQKLQKTVVLGGIAVFTVITATVVFPSITYPELLP